MLQKGGETLIACNTGSISVAKGVKTLLHVMLVIERFSKFSPSVARGVKPLLHVMLVVLVLQKG